MEFVSSIQHAPLEQGLITLGIVPLQRNRGHRSDFRGSTDKSSDRKGLGALNLLPDLLTNGSIVRGGGAAGQSGKTAAEHRRRGRGR